MNRRERKAAAKSDPTAPNLPATANTPAALYAAGLQHFRAGAHLDAHICCQQALALDAAYADALHLMGLLSLEAKQYDHALEWLTRAIRQEAKTDYLTSLGNMLLQQGRFADALATFDKAVQLNPNDADLWRNLGNALAKAGRPVDSLLSFEHALKLNPCYWDAAYKAALLLYRLERYGEALVYFNACDKLQPKHFLTLYMRALTLKQLGRFEEALADNRRAYVLDSNHADNCNDMGNVLGSLGRHDEATTWYDRSLKLAPNVAATLTNKAFALTNLGRFDEALAAYQQARAIEPTLAAIEWNMSLLQLLTGNLEAGFRGREARWKVSTLPGTIGYPKFTQPMWDGEENIDGKTILVCEDEGFGDTIQFARYAPLLAARGARVLLMVQDGLQPLVSGISGVAECIPVSNTALPPFDMHCPTMSLPLAFGTTLETIPSANYLPPISAERIKVWDDRLDPHDRLRVGLVWSGNPNHTNDRNRSMPLQNLTPLLDLDATFFSLQKNPRPNDKALLSERTDIIDLTGHCTNFLETAALISCLDLVITVDTGVAHLAGGLGCPTWILLPYTPDWRWLLDRDDSPWYPTVRLFRQDDKRDYTSVVDRVRNELLTLISNQ